MSFVLRVLYRYDSVWQRIGSPPWTPVLQVFASCPRELLISPTSQYFEEIIYFYIPLTVLGLQLRQFLFFNRFSPFLLYFLRHSISGTGQQITLLKNEKREETIITIQNWTIRRQESGRYDERYNCVINYVASKKEKSS